MFVKQSKKQNKAKLCCLSEIQIRCESHFIWQPCCSAVVLAYHVPGPAIKKKKKG
jgi:hypothetical protein